jgi:DNA-binding GntR family transcriptional regulator
MVARSRPTGSTEPAKQSLGETVYAALRRAIIRCELRPGQQITEGELAERFGAAKATLRVILNRLSHERLVQILPREGYLIAPLTLKQVQDLFGARLVLEPAVARLAAGHLDEAQRKFLDGLCQERYRVGDQESIEEFLSHNAACHVAVARATGNERLADMIADLLAEMERVLHFSYLPGDRNEVGRSEGDALLGCPAAGGGAGGNAEFVVDRAQVLVHRARREEQALGGLGVGEALGDEAQYLHLARGEASGIRTFGRSG